MLDRLPTKLLSDILQLAEHERWGSKHLYAVSLVSRRLYAVALPLIWRRISLNRDEQVSSILAGLESKKTSVTRHLFVSVLGSHDDVYLSEVLGALPNLEKVTLAGPFFELEELSKLADLASLRSLVLVEAILKEQIFAHHDFVFRSLVLFEIDGATILEESIEHLLLPRHFPALRVLRLSRLVVRPESHVYYIPVLSPALLQQLTVLEVELSIMHGLDSPPTYLQPFADKVLFVAEWYLPFPEYLTAIGIRHLALELPDWVVETTNDEEALDSAEMWSAVVALLRSSQRALAELWIPSIYQPPAGLPEPIASARTQLLAAAEETSVQVRWGEDWKDEFCEIRGVNVRGMGWK